MSNILSSCRTHCCDQHGCKYAHDDCPVMSGIIKQEGPCQLCGENNYHGDGSYYNDHMKWIPSKADALALVCHSAKALLIAIKEDDDVDLRTWKRNKRNAEDTLINALKTAGQWES